MLGFIIRNIYLVFVPVSGTEVLNPLEFHSDESYQGVFCYVKEVTFGLHLMMGSGCQWCLAEDHGIKGLELTVPYVYPPPPQGEESGLRLSSIHNGQ